MARIQRHSLLLGVAAMFALSWPFYERWGLFVGWGLALAALAITAWAHGQAGVVALLRRFLIWRVSPRWYLIVLLGPALLYLLALALFTLTTGTRPDPSLTEARSLFGPSITPWLGAIPFLLFDALSNGEELAWRGFLLPRLQARHSALRSSLVVGMLWGVWHLPKFWAAPDAGQIAFVIAHAILVAILYTWVFNSTHGSLLLVTLLHAAFNTAYVLLPVNPAAAGTPLIQVFVLVAEALAALGVIWATGPTHLSHLPRVIHDDHGDAPHVVPPRASPTAGSGQ